MLFVAALAALVGCAAGSSAQPTIGPTSSVPDPTAVPARAAPVTIRSTEQIGTTAPTTSAPATTAAPTTTAAPATTGAPTTTVTAAPATTGAPTTTVTAPPTTTAAVATVPPTTAAPSYAFDVAALPAASCKISRALQTGASGDDVRCLQQRLNAAMSTGPQLTADGNFGPVTDTAVRAFQTQLGLTVDGIAGRQTAQALTAWQDPPAAPAQAQQFVGSGDCHPSYPTVCIPPPGRDLDCGDIPHRRFTVQGADPHRFDGDDDGIGCET